MEKVYVVFGHSGEYEDFHSFIIKIYKNKEMAEKKVKDLKVIEKEEENKMKKEDGYYYEETWFTIDEEELEK